MPDFENPYLEPRKPSPGEKEVATGSLLVELFRLLGIRMIYQKDVDAVQRVGIGQEMVAQYHVPFGKFSGFVASVIHGLVNCAFTLTTFGVHS